MHTNDDYLAAVDLGGSKVTVLIADCKGRIVARRQEPLQTTGGDFVPKEASKGGDTTPGVDWYGPASQIERMLRSMLEERGISSVAGIGIGSAGPLQSGGIRNPPNFAVTVPEGMPTSPLFVPLSNPLKQAFKAPVSLENDCNTAVLGETFFGVGKDVENKETLHLVYVTISTGLGAGVWSGGHFLLGKHGNAAEVGHILVKENGLRCGCGNYGCAEAYCSGSGMIQNARIRLVDNGLRSQTPLTSLIQQEAKNGNFPDLQNWQLLELVTPQLIFRAAEYGDDIAKSVVSDFIHYGGITLSAIANAYDPATITLGGSIAVNHPEIVEPMKQEMLLHLNVFPPEVRITPLGKKAVEYGAMVLAQKRAC